MCRHPAALDLHRLRQLVKDLQGVGPVALRLVDPHQVIERRAAVFPRSRQLLEQPLRPVHEPGAQVIQRQRESRLVIERRAALLPQA